MSAGTRFDIYLQSSYAVIFRRFYPIPLLFPDEKRFDLLAFSAVSHLEALGVQVRQTPHKIIAFSCDFQNFLQSAPAKKLNLQSLVNIQSCLCWWQIGLLSFEMIHSESVMIARSLLKALILCTKLFYCLACQL